MEQIGKIVSVPPTQSGQGRNGEWQKNAFVIEWSDNGYKQLLCLEVMGAEKWDKMSQNVVVGNEVLVKFSVGSREYNGRWFTACSCYYCGAVGDQVHTQHIADPSHAVPTGQAAPPPMNDDEVPF